MAFTTPRICAFHLRLEANVVHVFTAFCVYSLLFVICFFLNENITKKQLFTARQARSHVLWISGPGGDI